MFGAWRLFAVLLLLLHSSATMAIVTVGPGCIFPTLAQAVNAVLDKERANDPRNPADVFIGVVGGLSYNEVLNIDSSNITSYPVQFLDVTFDHAFIQIFGDYAGDCTTENGSTATITASNKAGSVMFIHGNQQIEVVLKNLVLRDANNNNLAGTGGGINFTGQGILDTTNVTIFNNTATDGGGLFADGLGTGLTLKLRSGTFIDGNFARGGGGGMSVTGNVDLTPVESLLIENNIADSDNNKNGNGGGINFTGAQGWTLPNTTLVSNRAAFGGGISVTAGTLTLDSNVVVQGNSATGDGGGINVDGLGRLIAAKPQTLIDFNHAASGRGGGINLSGARADVGSPGYSGTPVVYMNDAKDGGGIAAVAGANPAGIRLFTTDPAQPVSIMANNAVNGGGIYLRQFTGVLDGGADAGLCAYNFRIDDNVAVEGTAIYADTNNQNGGANTSSASDVIFLNINDSGNFFSPPNGFAGFVCNPEPAANFGAKGACSSGIPCSEISGNRGVDPLLGNDAPSDGATIQLNNGGSSSGGGDTILTADRLRIQHNTGGRVMKGDTGNINDDATVSLTNCLITNNQASIDLMSVEKLNITSCTLSDDTIGADHVVHSGVLFSLIDSIFNEGSIPVIDDVSIVDIAFSLTQGNTVPQGTGGAAFLVVADPEFVDAANGDYHLQGTSRALDLAPASTGPGQFGNGADLDGKSRAVDLQGINDSLGDPRDAGAYELQSLPPGCHRTDTIFCTGFEAQ